MGQGASTEARDDQAAGPDSSAEASDTALPSALVICGPSGVGKGTLIKKMMEDSEKFGFSCSHTTRSPRPGEKVPQPSNTSFRPCLHIHNLNEANQI